MTWLCPTTLAQKPTVATSRAKTTGSIAYTIQAKQSQIAFLWKLEERLIPAAYDHVVQTDQPTGTIIWNAGDVGKCKLNLSFPVNSLQVDPGDSRAKYRLKKGMPTEKEKAAFRRKILRKPQLYAKRFPTISFVSESCEQRANGWTRVNGALTLRGVTKRVKADLRITTQDGAFQAQGRFRANRLDFSMLKLTFSTGAFTYRDELDFRINVVATP